MKIQKALFIFVGILSLTSSAQAAQCPEVLSSIYTYIFNSSATRSLELGLSLHRLQTQGSPQHDADLTRVESAIAFLPSLTVRGKGYARDIAYGTGFGISRDDQTAFKICSGNYSVSVDNPAYKTASFYELWVTEYKSAQVTIRDELSELARLLENLNQRVQTARASQPKSSNSKALDELAQKVPAMQAYLAEGTRIILQ